MIFIILNYSSLRTLGELILGPAHQPTKLATAAFFREFSNLSFLSQPIISQARKVTTLTVSTGKKSSPFNFHLTKL
jgi:hypothetical protein